jgi:hypothetical protein
VRGHRTVDAFSRPGRELIGLPGLAWLRDVRWPMASAVLDGEAVLPQEGMLPRCAALLAQFRLVTHCPRV